MFRSSVNRRRRWCPALTLLVLGCVGAISSSAAEAAGLTLDQVMHEALVRNHDLKAARAQVDAALGRLEQAGLWPNPRLQLTNATDRPFANVGEFSRSIGFSQDFPISGRLGLAENVARVDVARALSEVNEAERKLLGDVSVAFFDVLVADQKIALDDRLIHASESFVDAVSNRYKAGEVSELDVNAATLALLRLKQERSVAVGNRAAALGTLTGLAGFGAASGLTINSALPPLKTPLSSERLIEHALRLRPDLRLLSLSADRANAERVLAKAAAWEDWGVSLGVTQDKLVIDGAPPQSASDALTLSLSIPMPLFNRNQGTQASASADALTAREQLVALGQRVENEVAGTHELVTQLLKALQAFEKNALPLARRNTELARAAYRKGEVSIADVIQAVRQESEVAASYGDALAGYLKGVAQLNTATVSDEALMTHPMQPADAKSGDQ